MVFEILNEMSRLLMYDHRATCQGHGRCSFCKYFDVFLAKIVGIKSLPVSVPVSEIV